MRRVPSAVIIASVGLLVLAQPGVAAGDAPTRSSIPFSTSGVARTTCGFRIDWTASGTFEVTSFVDQNGAWRASITRWVGTEIDTNAKTGTSITGTWRRSISKRPDRRRSWARSTSIPSPATATSSWRRGASSSTSERVNGSSRPAGPIGRPATCRRGARHSRRPRHLSHRCIGGRMGIRRGRVLCAIGGGEDARGTS